MFPVKTLPFIPGPAHEAFPSLSKTSCQLFFNSGNGLGVFLQASFWRLVFLCVPMAPMVGLSQGLSICWVHSVLKGVLYSTCTVDSTS